MNLRTNLPASHQEHKRTEPSPRSLPRKGLDSEQVVTARQQYGENRISRKKSRGFFSHLLENLADPIIKILLIALAINLVFLSEHANWYETAGIALAVLLAVLISTLSELGSESAFRRLAEEAAKIRCRVIRRDGIIELPVEDIVVGDLVSLQAGDKVPADGHLIDGLLEVDQSALNGESVEVIKSAAPDEPGPLNADLLHPHQLAGGTVVCAGQGIMRVAAVGDTTFYGRLAGEIQEEKGKSPLKERLAHLAAVISRFGYMGALLVALAYLFNVIFIANGFQYAAIAAAMRNPQWLFTNLLHAATLAVTVIVMAVPEGLPMMISVVLSSNMRRMLKDNVLVRKLVGIETAGSLNILFTDKTGTLTKGALQVVGFVDGAGRVWNKGDKLYEQPLWKELHRAIAFNSSAEMSKGRAVGGNPTDRALLEYVSAHPLRHKLNRRRIFPFNSQSKYMATEVSGDLWCTLIKGAPEIILPHCREYITIGGQTMPITNKRQFEKSLRDLQNDAARLIAVAVSKQPLADPRDFGPLKLIGLLAVRDDVRGKAAEGVRQIRQAGIQAVMITGDSQLTAEAIARRTGILDGEEGLVMTSAELAALGDEQLAAILPQLRVVARALPQDKSRLVRIAQAQGLVTGMTGDGVNDAPALKRADVGFAMGSGAEIAKEAGDIVILDDNLLSIAKAVRYGRTIFKSIRKFIIFQLTLNFCAVLVSVIAPFLGVDTPITVIQMLWINMVMDTLAGLAFGGEAALLEYMKEPPKKRDERIINPYMWREIALGGAYAVFLSLWFLKSPLVAGVFAGASETRFLTAFFALFMFTGIMSSFCARTHHIYLLDHLAANKPFIVIMSLISLIQIAILYFGGAVFRTNGLALSELLLVLLLASTAMLVGLLRKLVYRACGLPSGT